MALKIIPYLFVVILAQGSSQNYQREYVKVPEGGNIVLNCSFTDPDGSVLEWTNMKSHIIFFNELRGIQDQRYKLLHYADAHSMVSLSNVTLQDEGVYKCTYYSSQLRIKEVNVIVLAPPSHPILNVSEIISNDNMYKKLTCHTFGSKPAPKITWLLNNTLEISGITESKFDEARKKCNTTSTLVIRPRHYSLRVDCIVRHESQANEIQIIALNIANYGNMEVSTIDTSTISEFVRGDTQSTKALTTNSPLERIMMTTQPLTPIVSSEMTTAALHTKKTLLSTTVDAEVSPSDASSVLKYAFTDFSSKALHTTDSHRVTETARQQFSISASNQSKTEIPVTEQTSYLTSAAFPMETSPPEALTIFAELSDNTPQTTEKHTESKPALYPFHTQRTSWNRTASSTDTVQTLFPSTTLLRTRTSQNFSSSTLQTTSVDTEVTLSEADKTTPSLFTNDISSENISAVSDIEDALQLISTTLIMNISTAEESPLLTVTEFRQTDFRTTFHTYDSDTEVETTTHSQFTISKLPENTGIPTGSGATVPYKDMTVPFNTNAHKNHSAISNVFLTITSYNQTEALHPASQSSNPTFENRTSDEEHLPDTVVFNQTEEIQPGNENSSSVPQDGNTHIVNHGEKHNKLFKKESGTLLLILVTFTMCALLIIVHLFLVKLRKAHLLWKREKESSETTLESNRSRSNNEENNSGLERYRQGSSRSHGLQYPKTQIPETVQEETEVSATSDHQAMCIPEHTKQYIMYMDETAV